MPALNATLRRASAAVIVVIVGAPGSAAGITLTRGDVAGPEPAALVATAET